MKKWNLTKFLEEEERNINSNSELKDNIKKSISAKFLNLKNTFRLSPGDIEDTTVQNPDNYKIASRTQEFEITQELVDDTTEISIQNYFEVSNVVDYLLLHKKMILDLSTSIPEESRRIIDFLCGIIFIKKGTIENLDPKKYLILLN
ncbi:cell division protein SepF [Spiroplasma endosymbiont of Amphibalanus improvisus]|uniref:cell division protein SepF n=1 Tax=Spiroplasma endosymbiont of Amphibalanus improvisus TaxID=3066327 RepID=UPI00313F0B2A